MATKLMKYNPSFLADTELIASFVVRETDLELILEVIRENIHSSNQHLLIIGPRGSGKTTLSRRVIAEVRAQPEYYSRWFPLPFGEESYEVASAGQFWLEALHHLGTQTGDVKWATIYQELLREHDDERLRLRALAKLMDFADETGKRLLLVVENLSLMFGEQLSGDDAWSLRHTLMEEPRIMLLGSSTSRFDTIETPGRPKHSKFDVQSRHEKITGSLHEKGDYSKAMYELFRIVQLEPLQVDECQRVWKMVTGKEIPEDQARAVRIITGGNPRLLTILSSFGANQSFQSLMEDLALLVDDHTDYFKSNIEGLPAAERKIFACLATIWEDATASEVATAARVTPSQASATLKRLEMRGAVKVVSLGKRKKKYQLAERLYNIYYLMRRGQDGGRVRAVVNFMVQFYGGGRLHAAAADIAREACGLDSEHRRMHCLALRELLGMPEGMKDRERIIAAIPLEFLQLPDAKTAIDIRSCDPIGDRISESKKMKAALKRAIKSRCWADGESILRDLLKYNENDGWAWAQLGHVLYKLNKMEEGIQCLRRAVALKPSYAWAWAGLGHILSSIGNWDEGIQTLRKAVELDTEYVWALAELGHTLSLGGQFDEAVACLRKAIELDKNYHWAYTTLGFTLMQLRKFDESVEILRKAIELAPDADGAWGALGHALTQLNKHEEAVECLRKSVELNPQFAWPWGRLGDALSLLGRNEEAVESLRKSVEVDSEYAWGWAKLGSVLASLDQSEEAVEYLSKAVDIDDSSAWAWAELGEALLHIGEEQEAIESLRKAVNLDPSYGWAWASLGSALSWQNNFEEGTSCLRKAVELQPENAWAWAELGRSLTQSGKPEDAEPCLRKSVKLNDKSAWGWTALGQTLSLLGKTDEALDCLRVVIELEPTRCYYWSLITVSLSYVKLGIGQLESLLIASGRHRDLLNNFSCGMMDSERYEHLEEIEAWAREAVGDPNNCPAHIRGTLSRVLALRGQFVESLEHVSASMADFKLTKSNIQEVSDVLTTAAAAGHGQEALDRLLASPSLEHLEPLAAGLKIYLGMEISAPQEIKEVAEDVVRRIDYWKHWHEGRGTLYAVSGTRS